MSINFYFELIRKNLIILVLVLVTYFAAAYYYVKNFVKINNDIYYYSEIMLPKNVFNYDFKNNLSNFIVELNTINKVNILTLASGDLDLAEFSRPITGFDPDSLLDFLLIEISNYENLDEDLAGFSSEISLEQIKIYKDLFTLSPQFDNDTLSKLQLSIKSNDKESYKYISELLRYSMIKFNSRIKGILLENITFNQNISEYLSYFQENLLTIKEVELTEKAKILEEVTDNGTTYREILMQKLMDEVDIKVLSRKKEILINNDKLISKINNYFDSNPYVLRSDILTVNNYELRTNTNNFIYIIALISGLFTTILISIARRRIN